MGAIKSPASIAFRRLGHVLKDSYPPWIAIFWGTGIFALNVSGYFLFNSNLFNGNAGNEKRH